MVARIEIVGISDSIVLRDDAVDFLRSSGGSGWGKAPVGNQWVDGSAPGRKFRGQRVLGRTYVLPVFVFGSDMDTINDRVRRLAKITRGEFMLRFTADDGAVFTIPAVYESGLAGDYAYGAQGADFRALTVFCPDPFWTSQEVQLIEWEFSAGEPFLLNRKLSGSDLSGPRQIRNEGDAESLPTWVFDGPFSSVQVSIDGSGFTYENAMLAGEQLRVQHDGWVWRVVDGNQANMFEGIAWNPRFPRVPAGESTVTLTLAGADVGTRVSMFWPERREVMF